ncbi:MAG: hypothetical protein H6765_03060 [Candidatus Peribacteria bacterium]|nr:MAG: hypothetical protein H6765_03060 [Candidatus Peribacteria bacterium]
MSHREIPHFGGTYISDQITIVPVRIQDIAFHATAFGHRVYDTLYPGSNNLAILSITADTRDNKNSTSSRDL